MLVFTLALPALDEKFGSGHSSSVSLGMKRLVPFEGNLNQKFYSNR